MLLDLSAHYNRKLFYLGTGVNEDYQSFCEAIRPGMTIVDVGGNEGLFTLAAARQLGSSGKVIAFEPLPRNYRYIIANLALNGFVDSSRFVVEPLALTNWDGEVELFLGPIGNPSVTTVGQTGTSRKSINVPCYRLDTYLHEKRISQVDLVKIDVEGAEGFVIDGMLDLLRGSRPPVLILEIHQEPLEGTKYTT